MKPKSNQRLLLGGIAVLAALSALISAQLFFLGGAVDDLRGAPADRWATGLAEDPAKGHAAAPITIVEFSDFQCPYCARFYAQTLPQLQAKYIDTGKVQFMYRDFPLEFHAMANKAAQAAECADEQGKFWQYHNRIFDNQGALSDASLRQWAADLGLDTAAFIACLESGRMAAEVAQDMREGAAAGVTGTPAFLINGRLLTGAQPFAAFEAAIEQQLAQT